jgi:hypothetical protein
MTTGSPCHGPAPGRTDKVTGSFCHGPAPGRTDKVTGSFCHGPAPGRTDKVTIRSRSAAAARTVSRFAVLFSLLSGLAGRTAAAATRAEDARPASGKGMRVLFIGNSLTAANSLPLIVQALAKSAGDELHVEAISPGATALDDHWNNGAALRAIARPGWNVVVLQQGPSSLPESRVHLRHWAKMFAEPIRKAGARPALYMVWPATDRLAYFDDVRTSYALAAADAGGMLLPAGEAWRAAWRRDPHAPLYGYDDFHPSPAGSYAAALSIYGMLYRRSPQGLPAKLTLADGQRLEVPPALAKLLQEAAAEANQKYGVP